MDERKLGPMRALERIRNAGAINITKAGDKWVAWAEPSVDCCGIGESPLAAMKALVERLTDVKKGHGPNG